MLRPAGLLDFDKVFGLGFENIKEEKIPKEVQKLVEEREQARQNKDFQSDRLRDKINSLSHEVGHSQRTKFLKDLIYLRNFFLYINKQQLRNSK